MSEGRKKMSRVVMEQIAEARYEAFLAHIDTLLKNSGYVKDEALMIREAMIASWNNGLGILKELSEAGMQFEYLPRESV